jgi:hypothetical protein
VPPAQLAPVPKQDTVKAPNKQAVIKPAKKEPSLTPQQPEIKSTREKMFEIKRPVPVLRAPLPPTKKAPVFVPNTRNQAQQRNQIAPKPGILDLRNTPSSQFIDERKTSIVPRGLLPDTGTTPPADKWREVRIPEVATDLEVLGLDQGWIRGGQIFTFEYDIFNKGSELWNFGGYLNVVLYLGTPESSLRWFNSATYAVPPVPGDRRMYFRREWPLRLNSPRPIWYTLRVQLEPNSADGDRRNDCFEMIWYQEHYQQVSGMRSGTRRDRFDCESVTIDPYRP